MQATEWDFGEVHPPSEHERAGRSTSRCRPAPEFADLRSRLRRFVFPMSAAFLIWYLAYVLLASYAPELHGDQGVRQHQRRPDFGLLQFVITFAITTVYVPFAGTLDPAAAQLREQIEEGAS